MNRTPIRFYTEDELDALEARDPDRAFEIARAQALAERGPRTPPAPNAPMPEVGPVEEALMGVRRILNRDGGDIEFVGLAGRIVRVRMKGACAGCPNSVIDLRDVVEKVLLGVPGVAGVE
ncbi:MAG TPA: NifU family protein, partial [Acidiferrobacteraceae bacterium]|nr:NifU family protein [Acidiferrobacteraceae bacterium]